MPILPSQPVCYPENLFESCTPGNGVVWWVLHTKPRAEKALARELYAAKIPYFLPEYTQHRTVRSKLRLTHLPLFTGYLFLLAEANQRVAALRTNYIVNCLTVVDQHTLHSQLQAIHRVISYDAKGCQPHVGLGKGDPVEVTEGPFAGLSGHVVRVESGYNFIIGVDFLSQSVEISLGAYGFRTNVQLGA